jgi:two-component system, NtrC family, nitrogen regulation sensor histidine kinase NtrY
MASKTYYIYTAAGILIIGLSSFLSAYTLFAQHNLIAGIVLLIIIIIEVFVYIKNLNRINRKIATFFNAVHNQDTSIQLPKNPGSKVISDIYAGMEKTIQVIQHVKMESQFREKLFMAMIEHSTTGFISIDEFGDFEIMNETARKLLGVEYTSNLDRLKTDIPDLYNTIINLIPGQSQSCRVIRPNFSTIVQVASSKLIYKEKKLTLISLLDIQKEIDARELDSWQKLIRIMNHEIMNSIAPITSASKSLIKFFIKDGQPIKKEELSDKTILDTINGLEVIDKMSDGLNYFVENYRKLSRVPEPVFTKIDLAKWNSSLKQILREFITKPDTVLEIEVKQGIKSFYGDERLLNQVIINLVKNADEAPNDTENKKISIKISPSPKANIEIQVKNNGAPIEKENLDKIFIPFFTSKENGAGIGLYISRQIVNLHNGNLSVVSNKDFGTVFRIVI